MKKDRYIGPAPTLPTCCKCGRSAVAGCHGCGKSYCEPHWIRHSHRAPDGTMDYTRDNDRLEIIK
jgi:hypothetical protein